MTPPVFASKKPLKVQPVRPGTATDGSGNAVVIMNVYLHGCPADVAVTQAVISAPSSGYGLKDVITLEGLTSSADSYSIVYPWLPKNTVTTVMDTDTMRFYGSAQTNEGQGDLYRATTIVLSANASGTGVSNGTAWAVKGETSARNVTPAVRPGYTLKGYEIAKPRPCAYMKLEIRAQGGDAHMQFSRLGFYE